MAQGIQTMRSKMTMLDDPRIINLDLLIKPADGSIPVVVKRKFCKRCEKGRTIGWISRVKNPVRCNFCKSPYWKDDYVLTQYAEWRTEKMKHLKATKPYVREKKLKLQES